MLVEIAWDCAVSLPFGSGLFISAGLTHLDIGVGSRLPTKRVQLRFPPIVSPVHLHYKSYLQ